MSDRKWYNPLVTWLLRSPLHGLMSGSAVLVTVTGRKSGRPYTLPISYHQSGETLTLITRRDKTWWRNVRGGAPVRLWLRGQEVAARAEVVDMDPAGLVAAVEQLWPRISPELAQKTAQASVLVRVNLERQTTPEPEAQRHV
jgi:deazaflavin-dependent oxidoreductase (nitroreductase family)